MGTPPNGIEAEVLVVGSYDELEKHKSEAKGKIIAWTHADLQTDIKDVFNGYEMFMSQPDKENTFLKGSRKERHFVELFLTWGMGKISSIMLGDELNDINAQPKMFHRSFLENLTNAPDDFSLDLYLLFQARVNGYEINQFSDISRSFDKTNFISIEIIRNNELILKEFELKYNKDMNKYIIGISSTNTPIINRFSLFNSLTQSIIFIPNYYYATFDYLIKSIKNKTITNELAGPIGMVKMADQLMLDKLKGVLFIFIMISLFVGIFNLIPIPLLDGGHIIYFTLRSIFADTLPHIVTRIYLTIGITIISFLFIFVTLNDIFYK